jgi:hypothetical protein
MQKTIKQWLELLPEPYRTQALVNMEPSKADVMQDSLHDAICRAFNWFKTPILQGYDYWNNIAIRANRGEFTPVPIQPTPLEANPAISPKRVRTKKQPITGAKRTTKLSTAIETLLMAAKAEGISLNIIVNPCS